MEIYVTIERRIISETVLSFVKIGNLSVWDMILLN